MARTNAAQGGIELIVKEYKQFKKAAQESNPVPLGLERVSGNEATKRFRDMTAAQKQGMIDKLGMEEVMKLVKSGVK